MESEIYVNLWNIPNNKVVVKIHRPEFGGSDAKYTIYLGQVPSLDTFWYAVQTVVNDYIKENFPSGYRPRINWYGIDELKFQIGPWESIKVTLAEHFPELQNESYCSVCMRTDSVMNMIVHLNDTHNWSREDIAQWVDQLQ